MIVSKISSILKKDWTQTTLEHKKELLRETVIQKKLKVYHFSMKVRYKYVSNTNSSYEKNLFSYLIMLMPYPALGLYCLSIKKHVEEERILEFRFESYMFVKPVRYHYDFSNEVECEEEERWSREDNPDYYQLPKAPAVFDLNDPFFLKLARPEILSIQEVYDYQAGFEESNVESFFEWFSRTPDHRDFVYSFYPRHFMEEDIQDYGCWLWRKELFPMQSRDITLMGRLGRMSEEEKVNWLKHDGPLKD